MCVLTLMRSGSIPFRVQMNKGFKYSRSSGAHICQKKNHFQVSTVFAS